MAMYWTNERLSDLIAQFRTHPVLWNPKHENYRDRLSKSRAWDDIASNLRVERYVCERKMNILRTQFRREWNRKKYSLMNGKIARESKWYAYRSLQFLEGVEQRGFRHRFSHQAENLHNLASVLQISSKWPNNINRRYQQMSIPQQVEKHRERGDSFCDQYQNVKCETLSNPDEENNENAIGPEPLSDEYPQDYSLREHHKMETDEHREEDLDDNEQEKCGSEGNLPDLQYFKENGLQNEGTNSALKSLKCISPQHIYGGQQTIQTRNIPIIETSTLVYQNINNENLEKYGPISTQPNDLSTHSSQIKISSSQPDNLSMIQPFSLSSHSNVPDVTFTQINNKMTQHNIAVHSNLQPKTITTYSTIKSSNSNVELSVAPIINQIQTSKPNFNIVQPNNIVKQLDAIAKESSTTNMQPNAAGDQNNQTSSDVITTKPNVRVCPRRASTVTPNVRPETRQTNNLRLRRRTINRLRNTANNWDNEDLNALIRNIVRDEVHNSRNMGASRDESVSYGEHVGYRLQRLSARARSIVTHLIDGILYEADMGIYDNQNNSRSLHDRVESNGDVKVESEDQNE